jgi:DNA-3-methyladenine glycosylase
LSQIPNRAGAGHPPSGLVPAPLTLKRLERAFFARDTVTVARDLLGQRLVRVTDGARLSGLICEVEAYGGPDDRASHAYRRTPRSAIMYGPPGHAYVYFIYGMYFCLNVVTEADGHPGAVLLRGLLPVEGIETVREHRPGARDSELTNGPGKLCAALGVRAAQNGTDLCTSDELFLEGSAAIPDEAVIVTPRVGVRGDSGAVARPWRFVWRPAPHAASGATPTAG